MEVFSMCDNNKFYICEHCGNLIGMIHDAGVPMMCCGQKMTKLEPGVVEASHEKHIPVVTVKDNIVTVTIGSVEHPMVEEHHIVCIKNGKMECDCANAWIGSPKTFYELQRCRSEKMENNATNLHVTSADLFREAIRLTKDESVGKDIFIHTFVSSLTNEFVYAYRLESFSEAQRLIPPGSNIPIIGTTVEGAFSVEYEETAENVIINVLQADISILYTKKYCHEKIQLVILAIPFVGSLFLCQRMDTYQPIGLFATKYQSGCIHE